MLNPINARDITQKSLVTQLLIFLGIDNIISIDHCMSRIRINVKDPNVLADEHFFLENKAKGIVRDNNSIHLIYGQQSPLIAKQLQDILTIFQESLIIDLLFICKGTEFIKNITYSENLFKIFFHNSFTIEEKSLLDWQKKYNYLATYYNFTLEISTEQAENLFSQIHYTLFYWDLLQCHYLFQQIPLEYISDISQFNNTIKLVLTANISIITNNYIKYGLSIEKDEINSQEILVSTQNSEFFTTIVKYYHFLKK